MLGDILKNSGIPNFKFEYSNLGTVLSPLLDIIILLAMFLTFWWLVWGAFEYMTAGGGKEGLAKARARITWAIIGLLFILIAFLIAQFIEQILEPRNNLLTSGNAFLASVTNTMTGEKGCDDSKAICTKQPNTTPVPISQVYSPEKLYDNQGEPLSIMADCSAGCTYPKNKVIWIYNQKKTELGVNWQGEDEFEKYGCQKAGTNSPGGSSCGPTSLAMIAESFNGPEVVNGERRYQTANNLTRFFLDRDLMKCTTGSLDANILAFLETSTREEIFNAFHVCIKDVHNPATFSELESWYNSYGYPTWVGVWYAGHKAGQNGSGDLGLPHYVTVAAISNNYIWVADPLGVPDENNSQYILRIKKDDFQKIYYRIKYWEVFPVGYCEEEFLGKI